MTMPLTLSMALAVASPLAQTAPRVPVLARECGDMSAFSMAAFRKPDSFFHPSAMWIWNDVLSADGVRDQLRDMASHGMLGVMPLGEPKEFRPTWMPTRLEPEYLSPGFMEHVRHTVDECDRLGMRVWLYDEGGWPSGSVCGRLVREHPEFARRILRHTQTAVKSNEQGKAPADALAAWLTAGPGSVRRLIPGEAFTAPAAGATLDVYSAPAGGSYTDLLSPDAVDTFLRMTHDVYASAVGDRFGGVIPMMFTDEPQASATPWTAGLPEDFRKTYGYDLLDRLPAIFDPRTDDDRRVRMDYYDWWSRRFADVYLGRIQDWCKRHGILSTGHLNGEDETMGAVKYGFGNLMRCMRRLDIPGVDVIWRQLWPGQTNGDFPKHASSVTHQEGTRWAMSESFAVYGSGLTPEQMKWITDYQLVRGITLFNLVAYPYSTSDWLAGGERPHFHENDPLWRWMPTYNAYAARMGYALSAGRSGATTALYFPMRDIWSGGAQSERAGAEFDKLCRAMLERQCDFDLIDDDVLTRAATHVSDGAVVVGGMRYSTVVVPPCRWMPDRSRSVLDALVTSGGRVMQIDGLDGAPRVAGAAAGSLAEIEGRLSRAVTPSDPAPWLRALTRETANGRLVFLTNEDVQERATRVTVSSASRPVILDAVTGEARQCSAARTKAGWAIDLDLSFAGSVLLLCPKRSVRAGDDAGAPGPVLRTLDGPWTLAPEARVELTGTEVRWVRPAGADPKPATPGEWASVLGEAFSGHAVYETEFTCTAPEASAAAWVDLGEVRYVADVELNCAPVGRLCWSPFAVNVRGKVRPGVNRLRITVGNTMANQYLKTDALARWKPNQLGPYHPRAAEFERDSLPSGLYGPVTLRAAATQRTK